MRYLFLSACLLLSLLSRAQSESKKPDTTQTTLYTYVEQMPEPGYDITKYLSEHLTYPDTAFKYNVQGRVIVKFIVNEDGSISDCKAEKGIGGGCDEEAIRVIRTMPKWKAGVHNGLPVRVSTMLPVSFTLSGEEKTVYSYVEQMPVINYNYYKYLAENLQYPDSARKNNIQGKVFVRFVVNENGTVSDAVLLSGVAGGCNNEAIRLIQNMPPWTPGEQNGKPVRVSFNLPVNFDLKPDSAVIKMLNDSASSKKAYKEDMPIPPYDMQMYLSNNIHYPDSARDNGVSGRVAVKFVVNENGSISDCKVVRKVCGVLDEEALRLVRNMPPWIPGLQNGKPVKVYFTLPIRFNVDGGAFDLKKNRVKPPDYIYDLSSDHPDEWPKADYDYIKYIVDHVQYPNSARQSKIQGDVVVKFVVYKDGKINDCEIIGHLDGSCDTEALRVIKSMPNWKAGIFYKKTINAEAIVTVSFYPSPEEKLRVESKKIYTYVEQMPSFSFDYQQYIVEHRKYPDSAKRKNITGTVIVRFIVSETGAIDSISVLKGIGGGCDEEAMRLVKNMPPMNPGKRDGKPVKVYLNVQVPFVKTMTVAEIVSSEKIRKAAIPKREYDFSQYIENSLHYPGLARKNNKEGVVIIKFGVNEDGIISNCTVKEGIGYGCDEEALRLVENMPPWTPGVKDGKSTIVYFTQGIVFALNDDRKSKKSKEKAYK